LNKQGRPLTKIIAWSSLYPACTAQNIYLPEAASP